MSRTLGQELGKLILEHGMAKNKVGLINYQTLPAQDYVDLISMCPNIELIDTTALFEMIRSSKSDEEIPFALRASEIAKEAQRIFAQAVRPGITEAELVAEVERGVRQRNGERSFFLISSNINIPYPYVPMEREITKKSPLLFSVEVSGPGGYWSQIVRPHFWEKPRGLLEKIYKILLELRLTAREELRPGRIVRDIAQTLRNVIHQNGFDYGIHFGHGLGLDVVEEPLINAENSFVLTKNHFVTIHPHIVNNNIGLWMGDMYFVGENGTEILSPLNDETN